ncbi:MAG: hypothetical protein AAGA05_14600 [Pseudomonadota bacterium]
MTSAVAEFRPDQNAYMRSHVWMAIAAMVAGVVVLRLIDNPHVWTGAPAGLLAIAVRGWYLASEELAVCWEIKDGVLAGAGNRVPLAQIAQVRRIGSYVQVITDQGNKHLIKYQADPAATVAAIEKARI